MLKIPNNTKLGFATVTWILGLVNLICRFVFNHKPLQIDQADPLLFPKNGFVLVIAKWCLLIEGKYKRCFI